MKQLNISSTRLFGLLVALVLGLGSNLQAQVQSMPYFQDFESFATCTGSCNSACVLSGGWVNSTTDNLEWTTDMGGTSSGSTGPAVDHNPGTSTGNYLYTETSSPCNGGDDTALVQSPPLDLNDTTGYGIYYWYHMYGATMGELHVDLSNDGGATWTLDITPAQIGDKGDVWLKNEINLVAWQGDTVIIRFRGISGTSFTSDMAIDDFGTFLVLPTDIGVSSIDSPTSPAIPGSNAVEVSITNFGTDTITSATVNWTVGGVAQTPFSWTGTLLPGGVDGPLNLGNATLPAGVTNITAWTSAPNGGTDQQTINDTSSVNILACQSLAGSYTVGGATADYPTIALAVDALLSCGVSGPVVMNINPGTYTENIDMQAEIPGASAVNTVAFNGGDATTTELVWDGSGGIATVLLWRTDYVTVKNLTIENTATVDAWGVHFRDTASYNVIDSCIIQMNGSATFDVEGVIASSSFTSSFTEGFNSYHNTISNNRFEGGTYGVHLEGSSLLPYTANGNVIHGNTFVSPYSYGVYVDNADTLTITNNVQLSNGSNNFGDGLYLLDIQNFVITGNYINSADWTIYMFDANDDYQVSNPSLLANNMFISETDHAGRFDDFVNVNLYHNTFYSGALTGTYFNDLDSVTMLNNIFYAATSDAIEFLDATNTIPGLVFDYNLLYSAGGGTLIDDGINLFTDLISWQLNNPAINVNSIEGDPDFYSPTNLHIAGTLPNDVGTPVGILIDIDGDPRSPTTPDIGADEFMPLPNDLGAIGFSSPVTDCGLSDSAIVSILVRNYGLDTAYTFDISYELGGVVVTETINDTLLPGVTDTFTFVATVDLSVPGTYDFTGWPTIIGDSNGNNDTTSYSVTNIPVLSTFPYFENFENGNGGWIASGSNTSWELATPANTVINSAFSGVNAWVTNATGLYSGNEDGAVVGPCFDFGALNDPIVRTKIWWNSEFSWDGTNLQSSIDGGATWQNVGAFGDPDNWYNDNTINGTPGGSQEGWTGRNSTGNGSGGWVTAKHKLDNLAGEPAVLLRMTFGSDGAVQDEGVAFDDFEIFENPPYNAEMLAVIEPVTGCGLSDSTYISVQITNVGQSTMDSLTFGFSLNGGAPVLEFTPDSVPSGGLYTYTFLAPSDFGTINTLYSLDVWVTAVGDTDPGNDSLLNVPIFHRNAISTFPYVETFDNPGGSLPTDWVNDPLDSGNDWIFDAGGTPTFGTGPATDHTFGTAAGFYAFVEDNFGTPLDDSVILITPCFDVTGTNGTKFSFWYHSNNSQGIGGANENQLHIDLLYNGTLTFDLIPPIIHKDNNWNFIELDMSIYNGVYAIAFRVDAENGSFTHDIAIDDIGVFEILPQDAGVADLFSPQSGCGLGVDTLQYGLENVGTDTIFSVDFSYQVNGGTVNTLTYSDTLVPGAVVILNLGPEDFSVPGTYNVLAWTSNLTGDSNQTNDTLSVDINSIPVVTSYPYFEDFESGNGGWLPVNDDPTTGAQNGTWELATPATTVMNSAASGVNAYVTNATGNYNNSDNSYVIGPCFDFTNLALPVIEMAVFWESEFSWDGMNLQGSVDGGVSWINIGASGDPNNWYTDNTINGAPGGSQEGWTGRTTTGNGSGGWLIAKHDMDTLAGFSDVRLRVNFGSDGSVQWEGVAFDDIFIYETPDNDLGVTSFISPAAGGCSDDSTLVFVQIINFGIQPQTGFPVTVNYTGAASGTVTSTYNDTIQAGDTTTFIVGYVNTNVGGTFNYVGYTDLTTDTLNFNDTTYLSSSITVTSTSPIAPDVEVCQTDSAQFTLVATAANAVDTTIIWFDSLTGGNQLMIGDTFVTSFLSTNTTFYAQAGAGSGASGSLTTFPNFAGGNGQSGNMFDVTALAGDITIDSFEIHIGATTVETVEIYYTTLPGGFTANATTPANWTLLGTQVVTGQGVGNPTSIDGMPSLSIPGGATYGMYVTLSTGTDIDYTNGVAGDFDDNGDLRLDYGSGVSYPFGGLINTRIWNGTLHYSSGCPSPRVPVQAIILPPAPVNIGPDAITCAGFVVDASNANLVSYLWNTGETTPSIVVDTSGSYYVDVMNIDGCVGSDTINLNILPSPSVDLGPDSLISCGNVVLDAGNAGSSFIWNVAGQFQQTLDVTSSGWYSVEADLNGCTDTDSIFVEILTTPSVDLGADIPACADVTLDAGNAGATFLWSTGATSQTIVVPAPVAGPDSVSVTVTNADGCTAVDEIIISVGVPPVVDLGADTTNCDSVMLDAGIAGATYLWNTGATSQTITATTPGPYSVTVTDQFGCSNSDDINVALELSPNADFTANQPNWGFTVDFTNLSTPGALYIWDFGDGSPLDSGTVNPSHIYGFAGAYTVTLTVTNDCGTDVHIFELGSIGLEDELFGQSIQVFPNPTGGLFYLNSAELRAEKLTIEVFDAKGSIIQRLEQNNVFGLNQEMDLSTQPVGVYLVKISDGDRTAVKRVVRE